MLIYEDIHYVTNSFCKNVPETVGPPSILVCEMHFVYMFPVVISLCGKLVVYLLILSRFKVVISASDYVTSLILVPSVS